MLTCKIIGVEAVTTHLNLIRDKAQPLLLQTVTNLTIELTRRIKEQYLSGSPLKVRTGKLRRSINYSVTSDANSIYGVVGSSAPYAAAHEFGVTSKPHRIEPRNGKALLFGSTSGVTSKAGRYLKSTSARAKLSEGIASGAMQFSKGVNHPGSVIPQRSFLRAALTEMGPQIIDTLNKALDEVTK